MTALVATLPIVAATPSARAQEGEGPSTVTVTNRDAQGWAVQSDAVSDGGGIGFVIAPTADLDNHPAPPGNLSLISDQPTAGGGVHRIVTSDSAGTALDDLGLAYSTLVTARAEEESDVTPYLILKVDLVVPDASGDPVTVGDSTPTVPGTLVFEPRYQATATAEGTWQRWDATADAAVWWSPTIVPGLATPLCTARPHDANTDNLSCQWEEILANQGAATVRSVAIATGDPLRSGDGDWVGLEAHADALDVGTAAGVTRYDFEFVADTSTADAHDAFALAPGSNDVFRFDLANPTTNPVALGVTGPGDDEELVGIDFHPVSGALYGATIDGGGFGRAYELGPVPTDGFDARLVTPVTFPLRGTAFGTSFDPAPDPAGRHLLHVVSEGGDHVAVDVDAGAATPSSPLVYDPAGDDAQTTPTLASLANASSPASVDVRVTGFPHLVESVATGGVLESRGTLDGVNTSLATGLAAAANHELFGVFTPGSFSWLRSLGSDASTTFPRRFGSGIVFHSLALPPTGTVRFATASAPPVAVGTPSFTVQVERTDGTYGDLTLDVVDVTSSSDVPADATDYAVSPAQVHFEHGSAVSQPVEVAISRPAGATGNVEVKLALADPRGAGNAVGDTDTFTLTLRGQQAATLEFGTAPAAAGEGDTRNLIVTRDGGDVAEVSARVRRVAAGDCTATPGSDYTGVPDDDQGLLIEFDDDTGDSVEVPIAVVDDLEAEPQEKACFELVSPSSAAVIGPQSTRELTINDDPHGTVAFELAEYSVKEGDTVVVTVNRTDGNEGATAVTASDAGTGSAVAGDDYQLPTDPSDLTHTFAAANNQDEQAFTVAITTTASPGIDPVRTVVLDLGKTGSAALGTAEATIAIRDRDVGKAFLVTDDGKLASFDPDSAGVGGPVSVGTPVTVEDPAGDPIQLAGIDFRPADRKLYGVAVGDEGTVVYEIDAVAARGTPVPTDDIGLIPGLPLPYPEAPALPGSAFGVDFDARTDTLRVVSNAGVQLIFNAETWQWIPGGPLAYGPDDLAGIDPAALDPGPPPTLVGDPVTIAGAPAVVGVAHDHNVDPELVPDLTPATAYGIDVNAQALVQVGTPEEDPALESGLVSPVGALPGATDTHAGVDITTDGRAFAVLSDGVASALYTLDLATGAATDVDGAALPGGPYTDIALAPSGVIRFTPTNPAMIEGEGGPPVVFTVERVGGTAGEVTVDLAAANAPGGPVEGSDFTLGFDPLIFPDGSAEPLPFSVTVLQDEVYEGDQVLELRLSNGGGGAVLAGDPGDTTSEVVLRDDPVGRLAFSEAPFSVVEDEGPAQISVTRVDGGEDVLTVDVVTQQRSTGSIAESGVDFTPLTSTLGEPMLTFPHGSEGAVLTQAVEIIADSTEERDELLDVKLQNWGVADAAPQPPSSATTSLTIRNDDHAGSVRLSDPAYVVSEDGGELTVTLERVPAGHADGALAVDFTASSPSGHTATPGADYSAVTNQRVTFGDGEATKTVAVTIFDDLEDPELEGDETLRVAISIPDPNPTDIPDRSEIVSPTTATVTIRDAEPGALWAVVADTGEDGAQELVRFDAARPGMVTLGPVNLSPLPDGQEIVALDRRPADGAYYALGVAADASATLYALDTASGALAVVGQLVDGVGNPFPVAPEAGMAIEPVGDFVRIVDTDAQSLRVEFPATTPSAQPVVEEPPVWHGDGTIPQIAGVAFADGAGSTAIQYDLDVAADVLATQAANGELTPAATVDDAASPAGLAVDNYGRVLAALPGSPSALHEIVVDEDRVREIGAIGSGLVVDALAPAPSAGVLGFDARELGPVGEDGDSGTRAEEVAVRRVGGTGELTFSYRVLDAAGNDVTPADPLPTRTIAADGDTATIAVPIARDNVYRLDVDNELRLQIYDVAGGAELGITEAALPVVDDDMPTVSISPTTPSAAEGVDGDSTPVAFTLTLSNPSARDTTVSVRTQDGAGEEGANFPSDYVKFDETVTIDPDTAVPPSKTVSVFVEGDGSDEHDETFRVSLESPTEASLGAALATVTILDDDDPPLVEVHPTTVEEGHLGQTTASVRVTLSESSGKTVTVEASTAADPDAEFPATEGEDYEPVTDHVVTFAPDDTERFVDVAVNGDVMDEENETFAVELSSLVNLDDTATDHVLAAVITIEDDDDPPVVLVGSVDVPEGTGAVRSASVPVRLSAPSGKTVRVTAATRDGSASASDDYKGRTETLAFEPGVDEVPFLVPIVADALDEFDEKFTVVLSDPVNATGTPSATVAIVDDDDPPTISVSDAEVLEGDVGTREMVFDVRLSGPSAKTVLITGATADDTATSGEDYASARGRGVFLPGVTSLPARVEVIGDTIDEPDEKFKVVLSDPVNVRIGKGVGVGTIVDDDESPVVQGVQIESGPLNSQSTPDGRGYWIATDEGDVFGFGNAERFGSLRGGVATAEVGAPVVDLTATADGDGYWLLDDQGGVFTFGAARFFGSLPGRVQQGMVGPAEVTDMTRTPSGDGYVILDEVGGVHTFGNADYHGSVPGRRASGMEIGQSRFLGIAVTADGGGYWILDEDGGVHTFGNARFHGSIPGLAAAGQNVGKAAATTIEPAPGGAGYWIFDRAGGVFTFGAARFAGSVPGLQHRS